MQEQEAARSTLSSRPIKNQPPHRGQKQKTPDLRQLQIKRILQTQRELKIKLQLQIQRDLRIQRKLQILQLQRKQKMLHMLTLPRHRSYISHPISPRKVW